MVSFSLTFYEKELQKDPVDVNTRTHKMVLAFFFLFFFLKKVGHSVGGVAAKPVQS